MGFSLGLGLIQPRAVIPDLFQVRPGDLAGEDRVVMRSVGLRIPGAVFELHLEPSPELLQVDVRLIEP